MRYFFIKIYYKSISEKNYTNEEKNRRYKNIIEEWIQEKEVMNKNQKKWLSSLKATIMQDTNISKTIYKGYHESLRGIEIWEANWKNKCVELNEYTNSIASKLGVARFVNFALSPNGVIVNYIANNPKKIEEIINKIFTEYQTKIDILNYQLSECNDLEISNEFKKQKLCAIANVYQCLEWVHPFLDGQGRTDLVLLAIILSKEGFNPAILEKPYTSTTALLPEWQAYLMQGVDLWKEEKSAQTEIINTSFRV